MDDQMTEMTNAPRPIGLGDAAPNFTARSTSGQLALADYRGRWLVFFSHPADFTPVCTTEFIAFAKRQADFDKLECSLLGLSVDSLYSHLAWVRAIEAHFGVAIGFPIVADPSMAIGRAYGMIDAAAQDSAAVRATYIIDPEGIVRAINIYPHTVGRSVDEILRTVAALQQTADGKRLTPEGWRPGDAFLAPPSEKVMEGNDLGWFCRTMDAP